MSAVMSSCGNRPGTSPFTWMPYGPHSTASDSVRFFTPALAAAECAKPGPPVHAYDAPTLMIEPGVPAPRWRRPNSRAQKNVPFSVMSTTVRHAFGDMSSAGHREVGGGVVHEHAGQPERVARRRRTRRRSTRARGCRTRRRARARRAPPSPRGRRRGAPPCGSRSRSTAPRRANSDAIALPSPVPPPVTNTHDARRTCRRGSAVAPTGRRRRESDRSRPCSSSAPGVARRRAPRRAAARISAMSSLRLMNVW